MKSIVDTYELIRTKMKSVCEEIEDVSIRAYEYQLGLALSIDGK